MNITDILSVLLSWGNITIMSFIPLKMENLIEKYVKYKIGIEVVRRDWFSKGSQTTKVLGYGLDIEDAIRSTYEDMKQRGILHDDA